MQFSNTEISSVLKVWDPSQQLNLGILCRLVARKHFPVEIREAYDIEKNGFFFAVRFKSEKEAYEVRRLLKEQNEGFVQIEVEFIDIKVIC